MPGVRDPGDVTEVTLRQRRPESEFWGSGVVVKVTVSDTCDRGPHAVVNVTASRWSMAAALPKLLFFFFFVIFALLLAFPASPDTVTSEIFPPCLPFLWLGIRTTL